MILVVLQVYYYFLKSIVRVAAAGPLYKKCSPFQGVTNHRHIGKKEHTVLLTAWRRMHSYGKTGLLVLFLGMMKKSYYVLIFVYTQK